MAKCGCCESTIDDGIKICPYCKAIQTDDKKLDDYERESAYNKYTKDIENHRSNNYVTSQQIKIDTTKDIHQIAEDLHFIKNLIVISLVVGLVSGFLLAFGILP